MPQPITELGTIVAGREGEDAVRHAELRGDGGPGIVSGDDLNILPRHPNVTQDQGQDALADAAEAKHHQAAVEGRMHGHD